MKLQIKTLNQKSLVIDIDEAKTVLDLKKELSLYPDVGVKPELQKIIYAGKILNNEDQISVYNIDVKKFLVIMILKQPLPELPSVSSQTAKQEEKKEQEEKPANTDEVNEEESEFKTPPNPVAEVKTPVNESKTDALVTQIVGMGYAEDDVRRALRASFNNPERAIEYLIEGIPTSPSTPEGESDTEGDLSMTPFEVFRNDPTFQSIRSALQEHPDLLDAAIEGIGATNPALLELISENQQEFLSMLVDGNDDDDDEVGDEDDDEEMSS